MMKTGYCNFSLSPHYVFIFLTRVFFFFMGVFSWANRSNCRCFEPPSCTLFPSPTLSDFSHSPVLFAEVAALERVACRSSQGLPLPGLRLFHCLYSKSPVNHRVQVTYFTLLCGQLQAFFEM